MDLWRIEFWNAKKIYDLRNFCTFCDYMSDLIRHWMKNVGLKIWKDKIIIIRKVALHCRLRSILFDFHYTLYTLYTFRWTLTWSIYLNLRHTYCLNSSIKALPFTDFHEQTFPMRETKKIHLIKTFVETMRNGSVMFDRNTQKLFSLRSQRNLT